MNIITLSICKIKLLWSSTFLFNQTVLKKFMKSCKYVPIKCIITVLLAKGLPFLETGDKCLDSSLPWLTLKLLLGHTTCNGPILVSSFHLQQIKLCNLQAEHFKLGWMNFHEWTPDQLFVDVPVSWSKHLAFDSLSPDILDGTPQLLCLGLGLKADKHWQDLLVWKEW